MAKTSKTAIEGSQQLGVFFRGEFTNPFNAAALCQVDEDAFAADIQQLISRLGRYRRMVTVVAVGVW